MLGPAVHRGKDTTHKTSETMCNARAWRKGRAVQTDPTLLWYASAIKKQKKCWELLPQKFYWFEPLRNNSQQHATTCNRVCKRTQRVTSNNVGSCWPTKFRPFAWGLKVLSNWSQVFVSKLILLLKKPSWFALGITEVWIWLPKTISHNLNNNLKSRYEPLHYCADLSLTWENRNILSKAITSV